MKTVIIGMAILYFVIGIVKYFRWCSLDRFDRPMWLRKPNVGNLLLTMLLWPVMRGG